MKAPPHLRGAIGKDEKEKEIERINSKCPYARSKWFLFFHPYSIHLIHQSYSSILFSHIEFKFKSK